MDKAKTYTCRCYDRHIAHCHQESNGNTKRRLSTSLISAPTYRYHAIATEVILTDNLGGGAIYQTLTAAREEAGII